MATDRQMIIERLDRKPAIIGHSFGGVLVQILARARGGRRDVRDRRRTFQRRATAAATP